ncbi:hypothetical protein [Streptomyces sp. NPDC051776]|uniref:hypothetical protein n=1 Tax=Streptomyces sp. NPDC051776 TaxID=3155414 RepID=UPI00341333B6
MTARSLRVTATALGVVASILLTACGGESEPKDEKIAGAEQGNGDKASESPKVSSSPAAGRPRIDLPSDLKYDFEWAKTGDKDKDAVLHDTEQFVKAVDLAIVEQNPLHKAYRFYSEGEAAAGSEKFIQEFVDYKDTITGSKRFYGPRVGIKRDGTASLVYCEDQSRSYNKSLKTGKVDKTSVTKNSFVVYSSRLRTNKDGIWVTEELTSQRGSAACQR